MGFFTTLKNLNYDTQNVTQNEGENDGQDDGQSVSQKLKPNDRRKQIVKIIETNSKITANDLSKYFKVSERTIERDLKVLTDEKIIEYVGSAKNGYWKVKE